MNDLFYSTNFESTVKDYEFTKLAQRKIQRVVTSDAFQDMLAEEIHDAILKDMQMVSFCDYLKRYLYEHACMEEPFATVEDAAYQEIIQGSFEDSCAPHSFQPTSTKWNVTVRNWLKSDRVRRETVFLLGFGLRMSAEDVSEFLMKVLKEDDFREDDPDEVIYRHCFATQQPYAVAKAWQERFPLLMDQEKDAYSGRGERKLVHQLLSIRNGDNQASSRNPQEQIWTEFDQLYEECRKIIAEIYQADEEEKPKSQRRKWTPEDINAGDLEQMMCSGIPRTDSGNLVKSNLSLLNRHFQAYRPSRQRIDLLLRRKQVPDRYDLVTLVFFLFSQQDMASEERFRLFLERANQVLRNCHMGPVYAANPYEAFLLICVLADWPLAVYGDIWELSYAKTQDE